jgi:hypothetical protein
MDWKKFFIIFFRNSFIAIGAITLLFGLFGLFTAGKQGLIGGVTWGLILGSLAIPYVAYMALAKAYEGFSGLIGGRITKIQMEGEKPQPEPEEKYFKK